jgi:hypothetical protein
MAENISLKQLELEKQRLVEIQKQLKATNDLTDAQKQQLSETEKAIKASDKRIAQAKKKIELQKIENKEFDSFARKFRQMSQDVQKQLQGTSKGAAVYLSLGRSISKEKAIQAKYAGKEDEKSRALLANSYDRESVMSEIASNAAAQAKATQKAEDDLRGVSDVEREILDIQNSKGLYNAVQKKQLIEQLKNTEQLRLKEERLKTIKEEQQGLFQALPSSVQNAVGFAKKLGSALKSGALPMVLIASLALAALSSFSKLDESAKAFRETTGLTNSQMEGIKSDANEITGNFAHLGVEAKTVFDTVAALKSEFSDVADFSQETTAALTVLSTNFGVSADNAAKVQGVLEQVSGLSSETAASVQLQVAEMARLAGVAPAKVMADIAESAEIASTLFKGDAEAIAASAIEARRLGTNLKSVAATAEKLLDFEGGIEEELTAATFVGGQFNLSRARALAFEGDILGAQKETLAQIQRSGDFRKKDYFTQQQLAKAAGMSVEEINKQLNAQEKLNSLSDEQKKAAEEAIKNGLDITDIDKENLATQVEAFSKQQEQQATLDKISNAFMGIAATVGSVLAPLLEGLGTILTFVLSPITAIVQGMAMFVNYVKESLPLMATLVTFAGTYLFLKNKALLTTQAEAAWELVKIGYQTTLNGIVAAGNLIKKRGLLGAIAEMAMRAFSSLSAIPFVGPALGVAAAAGALALGYSYYSKAGDIDSPADGKTRVSTKEGGLFELSPNDDLVAGPGASDAMGGKGGGMNLSALAAPLQAVVSEIKALRADLSAGKIAVYMDSQKVTNGVSNTVDQSTRNSYNLGTV